MYQYSSDVSSPGLMCHLAVTPPAADIEGYNKGVHAVLLFLYFCHHLSTNVNYDDDVHDDNDDDAQV